MPYVLPLSKALRTAGWKVKIYDRERLEPPHVTVYHRGRVWRVSLRDRTFLDMNDSWSQVAGGVRQALEAHWELLCAEWDRRFPENPVLRREDQ